MKLELEKDSHISLKSNSGSSEWKIYLQKEWEANGIHKLLPVIRERSSSYIFRRQKIIHFLDRDTAELSWSDLSHEKTWEWGKDDIDDMEKRFWMFFRWNLTVLPQLILYISHHPLLSALLCLFWLVGVTVCRPFRWFIEIRSRAWTAAAAEKVY